MAAENDEFYIPAYILSEYEELARERVRWRSISAELATPGRRISARAVRIAVFVTVAIGLVAGLTVVSVLTDDPLAIMVAVTLCSFAAVCVGVRLLYQHLVVKKRHKHSDII